MSYKIYLKENPIYKYFVDNFQIILGLKNYRQDSSNGGPREAMAGLYGEAIVRYEMGLLNKENIVQDLIAKKKRGIESDRGIDFEWQGIKVDVKTLQVKVSIASGITGTYCHNYMAKQAHDKNNETEILILCYLNWRQGILTINGGIEKIQMMDKEKISIFWQAGDTKPVGRKEHVFKYDEYEVQEHQIAKFNNLLDMKGYLYAYGQYKKGDGDNFQRAKKKRVFEYPEEKIHRGNGVPPEIPPGHGQENNNIKKGDGA